MNRAAMAKILKPPIFLIGNYRSGTTITQKLIGLHPGIVTWYEPRTLWLYADPGRRHDEFTECDATRKVARYIRSQFFNYQARNGNRQIMENTPSNVLRVPYVNAIFPDAIYLFIIRNPFSCISSMELKWQRTKTWSGIMRTLRSTPISQTPYYTMDYLNQVFQKKIIRRRYTPSYGARYFGIDKDLKNHDMLTVTARQWARGNRKAREDLARLGQGRVFSFRYEDLMQDTESVLRDIYDHCGLACSDEIVSAAREMVDPGRQEKWRRLDREQLRTILPEIRDEMAFHGYEIPASLR